MTVLKQDELEWYEPDDELVRRLRNLKWPEVPGEVRQRCWEQFNHMLSEWQQTHRVREPLHESARYDFSRRDTEGAGRRVASERLAAAHGVSRGLAWRQGPRRPLASTRYAFGLA